jgi:hypothetical protein
LVGSAGLTLLVGAAAAGALVGAGGWVGEALGAHAASS